MKFIIDFTDTTTQTDIDAFMTEHSITAIKTFSSFGKVFLVEAAVIPEVSGIVEAICADADSDIRLKAIHHDTAQETRDFTVNEDNWWKVTSYWSPNLEPNSTMTVPVNPAVFNVYVMDSGIDISHPEFVGQNVSNLWSVNGDFTDYRGHGTAIASLITGNTCSFSRANVFSVKIIKDGALTSRSELMEAFDQIQQHVNSNPGVPAIINMSWSIPNDEYINAKIQFMIDQKILCVAAAGNSGEPVADVTPAAITDVFTIGAYTEDFQPADFSNFSSDTSNTPNATNYGVIDMWAPGTNIRVARPGGTYGISSGTSMSAAIVSGAGAYNIALAFLAYDSTNGTNPYFQSQLSPTVDTMLQFINHRINILDMGPEYNQATNKIVTFNINGSATFTNNWRNYTKGTNYRTFVFAVEDIFLESESTSDVRIYICDDSDVETVEMLSGEMPPGIDWSYGYINGKYTGEPLGTVSNVNYESRWRLTSYDGTVTEFDLLISIRNHDNENYPVPADDPSYEINLLDGCQGIVPPPRCFLLNCQPGKPNMVCEGIKTGCFCVQ